MNLQTFVNLVDMLDKLKELSVDQKTIESHCLTVRRAYAELSSSDKKLIGTLANENLIEVLS